MRRLHIREALGSGTFGTVYAADLEGGSGFSHHVAVKVIAVSGPQAEMFIGRMRDEARLLGLLRDDHVVEALELVRIAGREAVLMERVDGVDLHALVEAGHRMPPRVLTDLGATLAGTLHRAHTALHPETAMPLDVVHRDVKPGNIMLTRSGGVKLLDFGVAKAAFAARESYTGQIVLGTLNYMAPEYIREASLTPAVDLYGLGISLLEAALGRTVGSPKLRQDSFERWRSGLLEELDGGHERMVPILRGLTAWDPDERPDGDSARHALRVLTDESTGVGLVSWAREVVRPMVARAEPADDRLGLSGSHHDLAAIPSPLSLGAGEGVPLRNSGSQPPFQETLDPTAFERLAVPARAAPPLEPARTVRMTGPMPLPDRPAGSPAPSQPVSVTPPSPRRATGHDSRPGATTGKPGSPSNIRRTVALGVALGGGVGLIVLIALLAVIGALR